MGRGRNISYTQAEMQAVWWAITIFSDKVGTKATLKALQSLHKKMEDARAPQTGATKWPFTVQQATEIARNVLGTRISFPPVITPAWYGNKNRFIASNGITEDIFLKACKLAERKWYGAVYFDTLLGGTMKLVATDEPEKPRFVGFANQEEEDDEENSLLSNRGARS